MTTLQHQITIDASIEEVWKTVADLSAVRHYNSTVSSVRLLSEQSEGVGAARRCELKPSGWVEERVWEWTPPDSIGLEVTASEWPLVFMKWKTVLRANGNSTIVTQEMNYKLKFGPLGALMDLLVMRPKIDKVIEEVFEDLRKFVEAGRG